MKKSLAIVLSTMLVFVFMLAGCGSAPDTKKDSSASTSTTDPATSQPTAAATTKELPKTNLILRTLHPDGDPFKQNLQDAIDEFNKTNQFNAQIQMETVTGADPYKTKIKVDVAAANGPDIFYWWAGGDMAPFAKSGSVLSFNEALDADKSWKDSFIGGMLDKASIDGKVYSIPSGSSITLVYYNKDIFAKYNLSVPKTYAELLANVKTLKQNGETPFSVGSKDSWLPGIFLHYFQNRVGGVEAYDAAVKNNKGWNTDSFLKAGQMLKELVDLDAFEKGTLTNDYTASENLFASGKAAMRVMINNEIGVFSDGKSAVKGKYGIFQFPSIEGGKGDVNDWLGQTDQNLAISSTTKNKEAAIAFVKMFTGSKYQKKNVEIAKLIPSTKVEFDKAALDPVLAEAIGFLNNAKHVFLFASSVTNPPEIGNAFLDSAQSIVAKQDPAKALQKVEDIAEKGK